MLFPLKKKNIFPLKRLHSADKEISRDEAKGLQYRICGMPCVLQGEDVTDLVWGYRMSAHCVERLDGYFI